MRDHEYKFVEFDLAIAARVDLFDERCDLFLGFEFAQMLERGGDLGSVNAAMEREIRGMMTNMGSVEKSTQRLESKQEKSKSRGDDQSEIE